MSYPNCPTIEKLIELNTIRRRREVIQKALEAKWKFEWTSQFEIDKNEPWKPPDQLIIDTKVLVPLAQLLSADRSVDSSDLKRSLESRNWLTEVCRADIVEGEESYHCRNCAADPSVLLCKTCYNEEEHEYHDVVKSTSSRGYCSCGLSLAFREKSFTCSVHHKSVESESFLLFSDTIELILERCRRPLTQLKFLETGTDYEKNEDFIRVQDSEHFVTLIIPMPGCDTAKMTELLKSEFGEQASGVILARLLEEGRCPVAISRDQNDSRTLAIKAHFRDCKVRQINATEYASQEMGYAVLNWVFQQSRSFRVLMSPIAKFHDNKGPMEEWYRSFPHMCKKQKQLLTIGLRQVLEMSNRLASMANQFKIDMYSRIEEYVKGDYSFDESILTMWTRVFRFAPLAQKYMDVLTKLFNGIGYFLQEHRKRKEDTTEKREEPSFIFVEQKDWANCFQRALHILQLARVFLNNDPKSNEWNESEFFRCMDSWAKLLFAFQGMNEINDIASGGTVNRCGFLIEEKLEPVMVKMAEWSNSRMIFHQVAVEACLKQLKTLEGTSFVDGRKLSFHCPLSRFFAMLFGAQPHFYEYLMVEDEGILDLRSKAFDAYTLLRKLVKSDSLSLCEPAIRILLLKGRLESSSSNPDFDWLRDWLHEYMKHPMLIERDIALVQIAFSIKQVDFTSRINDLFDGDVLLLMEQLRNRGLSREVDIMEQMCSLGLLINVERFSPGIAITTLEERKRRRILHRLTAEPMAVSELEESNDWLAVDLSDVAVKHSQSENYCLSPRDFEEMSYYYSSNRSYVYSKIHDESNTAYVIPSTSFGVAPEFATAFKPVTAFVCHLIENGFITSENITVDVSAAQSAMLTKLLYCLCIGLRDSEDEILTAIDEYAPELPERMEKLLIFPSKNSEMLRHVTEAFRAAASRPRGTAKSSKAIKQRKQKIRPTNGKFFTWIKLEPSECIGW